MFSPVGNLPPSVYWRRRLIILASAVLLLVLLVLTVRAIGGGDGGAVADGSTPASTSASSSAPSTPASSSARSSSRAASSSGSAAAHGTSGSGSAVPVACVAKSLDVRAVTPQTSYKVGDQPVVQLQVTNVGPAPCVQDLADGQVVLKVYNGESRVWGSHDCEIQPGTDKRTLMVGQAVRVSVTWSGRTSTAGCKGTRQRVGAGTYTLYAELSGRSGKAAQFSIS